MVFGVGLLAALVVGVAGAQAASLYAYADGTGMPSGCPQEPTGSSGSGCSLGTALSDAQAGGYG